MKPHLLAIAVAALVPWTPITAAGWTSPGTAAETRCFSPRDLILECEDQGDWSDAGERMYLPLIRASVQHGRHVYMLRRVVPIYVCRARLKRWRDLVRQVDSVCIEGDSSGDLPGGELLWAWDRLKTSRGTDCYFCD